MRPFGLHAARHTYASLALASGKSVCWTADQLGHASPMLTLETYAHAMREEEADLSFADFGVLTMGRIGGGDAVSDVAIGRGPSLDAEPVPEDENAPDPSDRGRSEFLERETGFEPATLTLAKRRKPKK